MFKTYSKILLAIAALLTAVDVASANEAHTRTSRSTCYKAIRPYSSVHLPGIGAAPQARQSGRCYVDRQGLRRSTHHLQSVPRVVGPIGYGATLYHSGRHTAKVTCTKKY